MNCLIGIRGSGKSAILECLRFALECLAESTEEMDLKYKQDLVRFSLGSGGKVVVEVEDAQGRRYEVRRILNERRDVYFDGELRPGVRIPLKNPLFFGRRNWLSGARGLSANWWNGCWALNSMPSEERLSLNANGCWTSWHISTN